VAAPPAKVVLFVGSVRVGRMAERLKIYVAGQLQKRGHKVIIIDPEEEQNLLQVRKPVHFHGPDETLPQWLAALHEHVVAADAYVVLCPEYNRCISPTLASAMDQFPPDSYRHKPCGVVAYSVGNGAGLVAAAQLRSFLGQLGMITLPFSSVNAKVQKSLSDDGTPLDEEFARGINKMLGELEWYCTALRNHKDVCGLPS
ncbi:unnamed protein product, partial [Ixodes pacificus]